MLGFRSRRIFRSRWSALWWAAGILFTAWQVTPSPDETEAAAPAPPPVHVNPWAKDPPAPR
ncbi:hypothetical protein OLX02_09770 [Novosphingobium sp. KCTC 2891]|uniref:hypothetical protein n=1 Tax=Novosphingobium sp. KCTC 2891 TaxID=2989730 RepID=UPI002221B37E|nr:hypothetical protein [Novosphingobium sp. KCTC 2891]MCW1383110.1 hypothetical protein [Novosphingobium sp. KCTC 2891]